MNYRSRIDLGVSATIVAIGAVFAIGAWQIDPASYEAIGPRAVPVFLACLMMGLGALIGISSLGSQRDTTEVESDDFGFRNSDVSRVLSVIGAGAVTTFVFWAAGYLLAMIVGTLLMLWVFGVRAPVVLIVVSVIAGITYQFVFMGLMGLLDPGGAIIDLRWLSRLITPGS